MWGLISSLPTKLPAFPCGGQNPLPHPFHTGVIGSVSGHCYSRCAPKHPPELVRDPHSLSSHPCSTEPVCILVRIPGRVIPVPILRQMLTCKVRSLPLWCSPDSFSLHFLLAQFPSSGDSDAFGRLLLSCHLGPCPPASPLPLGMFLACFPRHLVYYVVSGPCGMGVPPADFSLIILLIPLMFSFMVMFPM